MTISLKSFDIPLLKPSLDRKNILGRFIKITKAGFIKQTCKLTKILILEYCKNIQNFNFMI